MAGQIAPAHFGSFLVRQGNLPYLPSRVPPRRVEGPERVRGGPRCPCSGGSVIIDAPALEQVLADWRGDAQVLRRQGYNREAEQIERFADDVARAAEDYLRWLSEDDALLRSGRSRGWLRSHFPEWERAGHGRRDRGRRLYRMLVIPQRANTLAAREAGRRAAFNARLA